MTSPRLPLDGVTDTPTTARCPRCHTTVTLTSTGRLAPHGPIVARCPYTGLTPTQASAKLDAAARP